jgi:hypothetical protein
MSTPPFPTQTSNWTPLINLVGRNLAQDFMFVGNFGEIMIYRHRTTRCYLNVHISTGQTYRYNCDQGYLPIAPKVAIARALRHGCERGEMVNPSLKELN